MIFENSDVETTSLPPLRRAIAAACRLAEPACIGALLPAATLSPAAQTTANALAEALVQKMRARPATKLARMLRAYGLGSAQGLALMGLAEALLRIPDNATRNDLLRDKLRGRAWHGNPGLRLAGLLAATPAWHLAAPLIRAVAHRTIAGMADEFVLGETMDQALANSALREAQGFRYSYDMLGEAALTAEDAGRYEAAYDHAIATASAGRALHSNAGISIKLSALHPRYCRAQRGRVMAELLPRLAKLARGAKARNIGLTIDAEEADRLDLSLDLLQALCEDESLAGWHGLGFAVQAYGKRAPAVLDFCIDLAARTKHRLMLRLVKGAYWDSEIKQAQILGLADYPVFTRKIHTDISYLACARKMLGAGEIIFPQFATHNALTIAAIHTMAGDAPYEFQCLHGMGEDLYMDVLHRLGRPCRIYAPVGPHPTLLAYLTRRLLENGANASFINRLHDETFPMAELLRDPVSQAQNILPLGAPHEAIPLPAQLYGAARQNSAGLDLADETTLQNLSVALARQTAWPAIIQATAADIETACSHAAAYTPPPPPARAAMLRQLAGLLQDHREALIALLIREARKTLPAAIAEIREAVDYCRYYAAQIAAWDEATHIPLGPVLCISPWNFPLAIFLGQVVAAFAAGNAVLAKPAEQTPRIAAFTAGLLRQSGIPPGAVQLLQGDAATGARLVAESSIQGVVFTGSFHAAQHINHSLAQRTGNNGQPIPLIAETSGQNAMIADSSALPEQLIADVIISAFDSAGQRCSALRLLCLPQDAAPAILRRLRAALLEWRSGPPELLASDSGPVISAEAQAAILTHIAAMRAAGCRVTQAGAPPEGNFVPPTIIEISDLAALREEVFGPVLHIFTYHRPRLKKLLREINQLGYGLTFGIHSRIDARIAAATRTIRAGNIYINRNIIGAVVGVQPFGGHGLSGTGPKAGGPLYLHRLLRESPAMPPAPETLPGPAGERNQYSLRPRLAVLCLGKTAAGRQAQRAAVAAAGSRAVFRQNAQYAAVLLEGDDAAVRATSIMLARRPGPLIPLYALSSAALAKGARYNPAWLMQEISISTNIAAAGGNGELIAKI